MKYKKIPNETVQRLPVYLRALTFLKEDGQRCISSEKLADFVGINSWQIRKDFSFFGEFGVRGVGYDVVKLIVEIKGILKLDVVQKVALIGAGNLGSAIIAYPDFEEYGFDIAKVFDNDPKKIGKHIHKTKILDAAKISTLSKQNIKIGIIAVPKSVAQEIADKLVKAGVSCIMNFSPCHLVVPSVIKLVTIDIAVHLAQMPFYANYE